MTSVEPPFGGIPDRPGPIRDPGILAKIFEHGPDATLLVDADGRIVEVNAQAERVFGYPRAELVGSPVELLLPERFIGRHVAFRAGYMAAPRARPMGADMELFARRKDGTELPVDIMLSPLETEEGTLALAVVRDISDRRRADEKFRALLESAPDAMVIVDESGRIVLVNTQTERMFGYPRRELLGQPVELLIPARLRTQHRQHRTGYFEKPRARPMGAGLELFGVRRDGVEFPVEISLSPLQTTEGMLVSGAIRDITERRNAEDEARRAREMYLRELHHRVKNNLQVVSSLLFLQSAQASDPATLEILTESRNRVKSIALIHERLYRSPELTRIDFGEYVRELVGDLFRTYGVTEGRVAVDTRVRGVSLEIDTAIPCGLIVNELVSNALKHAFPEGRRGRLTLDVSQIAPKQYVLTVGDDGVGLPPSLDWHNGPSLGLRLVSDLSRQLDGEMEVQSNGGTTFRITFAEVHYKERS